jgi:hypothetical protein
MCGSERSAAHYTHFTLRRGHPVTATNWGLRNSLGGTSRTGSNIAVVLGVIGWKARTGLGRFTIVPNGGVWCGRHWIFCITKIPAFILASGTLPPSRQGLSYISICFRTPVLKLYNTFLNPVAEKPTHTNTSLIRILILRSDAYFTSSSQSVSHTVFFVTAIQLM